MPTASGKYRFETDSPEFFGSGTIHVIARGQSVIGRFGRVGVMRGSIEGRILKAEWTEGERRGWISLEFAPDYKSCICTYGMAGGPALQTARMLKVSRPPRSTRAFSGQQAKPQ